ncbi:hypothetical protein D3C78_1774720 [compost metagenome]
MRRCDKAEPVDITKRLEGLADFRIGGNAAGHDQSGLRLEMRKLFLKAGKATTDTVLERA